MDCLNAEFPDSYGHYREAKFAALKHHWWWKVRMPLASSQYYLGCLLYSLQHERY